MKVKNINGIRVNSCTCGSWLEHWKKYSDTPLSFFCAVLDCVQKPEAGALVQKEGNHDTGWYIVPLCTMHNKQYGTSPYITESVQLVSAAVDGTCGSIKNHAAGGTGIENSVTEANQGVKGKKP